MLEQAAVGVNVTLMTQFVVGCSGKLQLLVCENAPLLTMPLNVRAALPVFVTVIG